MLSELDLRRLGWVFNTDAGTATNGDTTVVAHVDQAPLFFLVRAAASIEGDASAGDPVTPDLVAATTGEQYVVLAPDAAEIAVALASIRVSRDGLLAGCDWTQLLDVPLSDVRRQTWATYRQQLRDYPNQQGFDPTAPPAWPTVPVF